MDTALINSLVGDYLSSFGSKLAEKFKKESKATPLPPGSPGLADVVKHFKETSPTKRKLSMSNGHTPAKKSKKEESSSDDDSDDSDEEAPAPKVVKPAAEKMEESEDDSTEEEEEEEKPAAKPAAKTAAKPAAKAAEESEEDSSDESDDEEPEVKTKTVAKPAAKKEESSDDDDDSDSDEEEEAKPAAKPVAKKEESSDDDSDDSDEEEDEKPAAKPAKPAAKAAKADESSDDSDDSDDEEEEAPVKKPEPEPEMKIKNNKNKVETPQKGGHNKSFNQPEGRKIFIHNVSEEATYEDFQTTVEKFGEVTDFFNPGRGFAFLEFSSNEEAQACIASMDNTDIAGRTIQMNIARPKGEKGADRGGRGGGRGGRGGAGGGGRRSDVEGAKLFVHNVSEETSQEDLRGAFEEHGTVTDAYNPGKGFAFVTFSSPDEAQAAIKAMDGANVCGRDIQCNVAKPRGESGGRGGGRGGGGRGGRGGRGGGRGGRGGMSINVGGGGGNKKKTFD